MSALLTLLSVVCFLFGAFASARPTVRSEGDSESDTVYYTFELTNGPAAPAGVSRSAILINGQTPGPTLEMNEGQTLSVNVINNLNDDATLHFHGLYHGGAPWYDGVPGVTQYPIPPGTNFTYVVTPTDQYGQYWYHSHYKSQIANGLRGALLIHPSPSRKRPFKSISKKNSTIEQLMAAEAKPSILTLTDWSNQDAEDLTKLYLRSGANPLCVDSYVINGKGQQFCPDLGYLQSVAFPYILPVSDKGCVYPNSTILASAIVGVNYTIVDPFYPGLEEVFPMEVIQVDPQAGYASINVVFAGSLYEKKVHQAFIKLDNPGDWTIRLSNPDFSAQVKSGYAVLSYVENGLASDKEWTTIPDTPSSTQSLDYGGNLINNATMVNELSLVPYPSTPPPSYSDHTLFMYIGQPDPRVWVLDGIAYLPWRSFDTPSIFDPQIALNAGVAASVDNGTVVDIIFVMPPGNPVHIGIGDGAFNWSSVAEAAEAQPAAFNLANPPLRDTYRTPTALEAPAWLAVRYEVVSPGPVFVHCHIDNHLQAGMAFVIMQGMDVGFPTPPQQIADTYHSIVSANPEPTLKDGYVYATA
ncbi:hypothetical protein CI109_104960 [Kwoniella shandongensis]|uniref:Multicopper oxidase n=1 Tax=Kwoniella shandongensis TaxID=1734106 RepID=A0AAJ8LPI5_9TREE